VTDVDSDTGYNTQKVEVFNNAPVVDLQYTYSGALTEGVTVNFVCNATGGNAPLAYVLDFGDGTSTTASSASHNYTPAGSYNATCTVTDADSDVGSDKELLVITNNAPIVNLALNTTAGYEPLSVNYTCSVGNGNAPFTYVVDFGDGSATSSSPTGSHNYPTPGNYTVTCTVTDADSDTGFNSQKVEVINYPPVASLTAVPSFGPEGLVVDFNCSSTGGNAPLSYSLSFGDGTSTTSQVVKHVYALEAVYNATCTVSDADSDVSTASVPINVTNNAPVVNLAHNVSVSGVGNVEPRNVGFVCSVGNGNAPFTYSLSFGDGSAPAATSTASHTYAQNGTYVANCTVTDTDGDVSSGTQTVIVVDSEPVTNFTYLPASPIEGNSIQFTDATTAYDGVVSWSWNFGDGNTSTLQNPTHTYYLQNTYIVTLTTTDADGSQTSMVKSVALGNNAPNVTVSVSPVSGTEPLTVAISCSASGGNAPLTYSVLYGDGQSTTSATSTHTYNQSGSYPVVCQVTDNDSDIGSDIRSVTVNDTKPTADFTWSPANPSAGQTVNFTDLSTGYDAIASWAWDFDNNGAVDATTKNATIVFSSPGLYIVNLTVTDSDGSTAWAAKSVAVNISIPAPLIFSVQTTGITNVSANATWATDQAANSRVDYGTTTALGSMASDASLTFSHNLMMPGLTPNTTYYYNVTSCNIFSACTTAGPYSFTTLATIMPDTTPPGPVTGLNETSVGTSWIVWGWTNPSDLDFNHVELRINGTFVANTSGTSYNVTGLSANTTYQIEVVTVDNTGNRNSPGATDSATTQASVIPDTTPPGHVTNLNETGVGTDWIVWGWTNPTDLDFNHVELWRNGTFVANTSGVSYNVTGLSANTTYQIEVVTVDNTGNRNSPGATDSATTLSSVLPDTTPPGPVTGLNESGGVGTSWIAWSWTNPSDADFNHAELWLNGTFLTNTSANNYNATGLLPNTTYQITVITVDNTGNRNTPGVSDPATTAAIMNSVPVVSISATPMSGAVPLQVQFNSTVTGGDAPLSYAWDFNSDGTADSTLQNPIYIYNAAGTYTAVLNVTDSNGDRDSDSMSVTASAVTHDIAVNFLNYTNENRTIYLYDPVQVNASVTNEGNVAETFTVQLQVGTSVVDTMNVTLAAGATTTVSLDWASATPKDFHTVLVRALPVAGEIDISDQSATKLLRAWSVNDIVDNSTRYVVYWAGTAYVPVLNAYVERTFYDLDVRLSSTTAIITPPATQTVTLNPSETKILLWTVAALPGDVLTVTEGNNELTFSNTV
jgi:PKD repeat protein